MLPVNEMAASENSVQIHDCGTVPDDKGRVKCNYCGKIVSGFARLRYHLSSIRKVVGPCPLVPLNIRELFTNEIEKNTESVDKGTISIDHTDSPLKYCSPCDNTRNAATRTSSSKSKKHRKVVSLSERRSKKLTSSPGSRELAVAVRGCGDSSLKELQKSIVRFFCETRLDFSEANSDSFMKMIESAVRHGQLQHAVPSFLDLKQCLFSDVLEEIKQYVKDIRTSWESTGCSILLDGWKDSTGRDLMNVLVDCPRGAIYLRSVDLSSFSGDVNAIEGLLEDILEDVGLHNVVQIITDSIPACMHEVGKNLMKKHRTWYWTACASRCLELMLDKFVMLESFRKTLKNAKAVSRFLSSHADVLKLVGDHACLANLVRLSKIRSVTTFNTLENILCNERNLRSFFTSSHWNKSNLASTEEGRRVASLVCNENFWNTVEIMVKSAIPLVRILEIFTSENTPQLGSVYEIVDQAKETIRNGFKGKKAQYKPFWNIIDEIWNTYLYTPLHPTGYFLNARLFYCDDFHLDPEVTTGLLNCITRLGGSTSTLDLVVDQIDEYRLAKGKFCPGSVIENILDISPENWWLKYGGDCPELEKLAIRILSQTCTGGSKYNLKKAVAEMIFEVERGMNPMEQQRLSERPFIYYNMHLQKIANDLSGDELDMKNDWIMEENTMEIDDGCLIDVEIASPLQKLEDTNGAEGP